MPSKPFNVLSNTLKETIERNQSTLTYLNDVKNYGWEKWFQVELAATLNKNGTAYIETPYSLDLRKKLPKNKREFSNCYVDIKYLIANQLRERFNVVELKIAKKTSVLRSVLTDLNKIAAIRSKEWDIRSVCVVLIHGPVASQSKFTSIAESLKNHNLPNNAQLNVERSPIKNTDFHLVIIGWQRGATAKMNKASYSTWLDQVSKIFKAKGVKQKH